MRDASDFGGMAGAYLQEDGSPIARYDAMECDRRFTKCDSRDKNSESESQGIREENWNKNHKNDLSSRSHSEMKIGNNEIPLVRNPKKQSHRSWSESSGIAQQ
jgi:hypothetical protein